MDKSTGKALVGFIVGAAFGAAAGILFAPKAGTETRKQIKQKSDEISREVTAMVGEKLDEMKSYVQDMTNDVKKKFHKVENA